MRARVRPRVLTYASSRLLRATTRRPRSRARPGGRRSRGSIPARRRLDPRHARSRGRPPDAWDSAASRRPRESRPAIEPPRPFRSIRVLFPSATASLRARIAAMRAKARSSRAGKVESARVPPDAALAGNPPMQAGSSAVARARGKASEDPAHAARRTVRVRAYSPRLRAVVSLFLRRPSFPRGRVPRASSAAVQRAARWIPRASLAARSRLAACASVPPSIRTACGGSTDKGAPWRTRRRSGSRSASA